MVENFRIPSPLGRDTRVTVGFAGASRRRPRGIRIESHRSRPVRLVSRLLKIVENFRISGPLGRDTRVTVGFPVGRSVRPAGVSYLTSG